MKQLAKTLLKRNHIIFYLFLAAIFFYCSSAGSPLHADAKKHKYIKARKLEQNLQNLKDDYKYTMHTYVVVLRDFINLCENLNEKIEPLEAKVKILEEQNIAQEKELIRVRNYIYRHTLNTDVFPPESGEDLDHIPVYIDGIRVDIPVYLDGIRVDRPLPAEVPSQP